MSRLFGFEVPTDDPRFPRHFEVRWEPPTVLDGAAKLNPALGAVRVWVYELHVSKRITIAAGLLGRRRPPDPAAQPPHLRPRRAVVGPRVSQDRAPAVNHRSVQAKGGAKSAVVKDMESETKRVDGGAEPVDARAMEREAFGLPEIRAENERLVLFAIEMRACGEL